MVRVCQADAGVETHVEALLAARKSVEVGLLLGRLGSGAKDYVLTLIRAPDNDGVPAATCSEAPAAGKAKKGASKPAAATIELDDMWVVEHARQVGRMLPGGIAVVGLYLFGPEAGFRQASRELASVAVESVGVAAGADDAARNNAGQDALLLHADSNSRKIVVKVATADGALQPADLKFVPLLDSFVALTCSFDVALSTPAPASAASVAALLQRMAAAERGRIRSVEGVLPSGLPDGDALVLDLLKAAPGGGGDGAGKGAAPGLPVELLCAMPSWDEDIGALVASVQGDAQGLATIQGRLHGRAYVHKRDTWSTALQALKADLAATLQARLDMMLEVEEEEYGEEEGAGKPELMTREGKGGHHVRALPRRVGLPLAGPLLACDYLGPEDGAEDALAHGAMLLALPPGGAVEEWEAPARPGGGCPEWKPAVESHLSDGGPAVAAAGEAAKGAPATCSVGALMVVAAVAGLALSYVVSSM
eukprot:jgi/Tetstr1/432729/TSEL_022095.t1